MRPLIERTKLQAQKLIELDELDAPPIRILIPNLHDPKYLFCATEKCIKAWNIEGAAQEWPIFVFCFSQV